ncbi:MAG: MYXO-CTERM sorting domain-containing protein [Myxococcales bacterium]
MRLRLTSLLLMTALASPSAAWADTTVVQQNEPTIAIANGSASAFNQKACEDGTVSTLIAYDYPSGFADQQVQLTVFATTKPCPQTAADTDLVLLHPTRITTISGNKSGTLKLVGKDLVKDCPANTEKVFNVCAVSSTLVANNSGVGTSWEVAFTKSVTFTYDSVQPTKPIITNVAAGDSTISFNWDSQAGTDHWVIYYRKHGSPPSSNTNICGSSSSGDASSGDSSLGGGAGGAEGDDAAATPPDAAAPGLDAGPTWDASPSFNPAETDGGVWSSVEIADNNNNISTGRVKDLTNDQQYEFVLVAVDQAGNVSTGSDPRDATPVTVHDFYRRYQCAGGNEKAGFGCSTAGMAVLVPIASLAALAFIRRRRAP